MSTTRSLKDLPKHLKWYAATRVPTPSSADEKCNVCWRPYSTVEKSEPAERLCHAVQLAPCGHLIGSKCLRELLGREHIKCPLCRKEITKIPAPVPAWITFLLRYDRFPLSPTKWIAPENGVKDLPMDQASIARFQQLHKRLFADNLDFNGGVELWFALLELPFVKTGDALTAVVMSNAFFHVIEEFLTIPDTHYNLFKISQYLLSFVGKDMGYMVPCLNVVVFAVLGSMLHPDGSWVCLGLAVRNVTRFVKLRWVLLLLTGNFWLFGVMVGWLIWMGVRRERYF